MGSNPISSTKIQKMHKAGVLDSGLFRGRTECITSDLPVTRARIIKKASVKQQWSISLRRVDGPIRSQAHPTIISFNRESHSSRRSIAGSTDSARCAGIHVAISPSNAIARTVPVNTRGSRGVA